MSNDIQKQYDRLDNVTSILQRMKEVYAIPGRHTRGIGRGIVSNSIPSKVLQRSRKLSKDELVLRLGDGKVVAAEAKDGIQQTMDDTDSSPNLDNIDMITDTAVVDKDEKTSLPKAKRQKKSTVWLEFKDVKDVDGNVKISCNHCVKMFVKSKGNPTSQLHKHLQQCANHLRAKATKERENSMQTQLGFMPSSVDPALYPALQDGKFDMEAMKESLAHRILMHEKSFSEVEEEGFNLFCRRGMPEWR
ncbi:UNVERIFIED_CONTAM: hypothetical protein Slati_2899500 [Sesamum latifolium]|uniref:BED-type domain-containing protein n=1 Tax=Sesamum latifolium TaxID=2727402 RepID=A0AAW2VGH5_9LAMI